MRITPGIPYPLHVYQDMKYWYPGSTRVDEEWDKNEGAHRTVAVYACRGGQNGRHLRAGQGLSGTMVKLEREAILSLIHI